MVRDVQQEAFDKRTAIAQVNGMELDRDRRGIVRYSDVEVQFPYDVLRSPMVAATLGFQIRDEPTPLTEDWLKSLYPELRKVSLFAVNRLLRGYSFLSGEHWIRPIVEGDIFYVQTGWLFPGISSPIEMMVGAPGHSIGLQAHPFSDWFHEELARWLASEKDVPIWLELVQDAREYLEVGRFRHVVIDSRTAVEVYVDQTLVTCFKQQALSPAEAAIQLKLSRPAAQSVPSLEEAIRLARINDKLKYGLKRALGIELARRKVWNDWLAVKEVREDSVHYGEDVSEEQARQCLEVVETLISAVHEAGSPVSVSLKPEAK